MWTMWTILAFMACNTAPIDYLSDDVVGNGSQAWDHPTNDGCEGHKDSERLGEFDWCAKYPGFVTIDNPIYTDCADITAEQLDLEVFEVFDGLLARAFDVLSMRSHELLHDTWNGVEVLVDW
jgi:hypothetical protein